MCLRVYPDHIIMTGSSSPLLLPHDSSLRINNIFWKFIVLLSGFVSVNLLTIRL